MTGSHLDQPYQERKESTISLLGKTGADGENIASADLQNPSDALEILAQVADRAEDGDSRSSGEPDQGRSQAKQLRPAPRRQGPSPPMNDQLYYKPVQDGMISPEMVYHLFSR